MIEPDPSLSPVEQEERRRVFWSFYVLDKLISCGRERPPAILDEDCKLRLPSDESSFVEGRLQVSPTLDDLASDRSPTTALSSKCTFALLVLMSSAFGKCAQYTLQEHKFPTQGTPWDPKSQFSTIYWTLLQLESNYGFGEPLIGRIQQDLTTNGLIDQQKAGPLVYAHALFHLCQCLLHHPFLLRQRLAKLETKAPLSFLTRAVDSCKSHALLLTNLINGVKSIGFRTTASFYGYYNFLPGTIHALFLNSEDNTSRDIAEKAFSSCVHNLHELSQYWKHASLMVIQLRVSPINYSGRTNPLQVTSLENFRAHSARLSGLLDSSSRAEQLSPADVAMLWESVDNGSLSTLQQSETEQEQALPSDFGSPFPNDLFDFSPLGHLSPSGYLSPFRSCPSPTISGNLNRSLRRMGGSANTRQHDADLFNGSSRSSQPLPMSFNFDMPRA